MECKQRAYRGSQKYQGRTRACELVCPRPWADGKISKSFHQGLSELNGFSQILFLWTCHVPKMVWQSQCLVRDQRFVLKRECPKLRRTIRCLGKQVQPGRRLGQVSLLHESYWSRQKDCLQEILASSLDICWSSKRCPVTSAFSHHARLHELGAQLFEQLDACPSIVSFLQDGHGQQHDSRHVV